jgi:carbon starvation protein CstA
LTEKIVDKLISLLRDSTLIQGSITLVCVCGIVYLWVTGKPVSDSLLGIVLLIIGYYFGSKTQQRIIKKEGNDAS